MRTTIQQASTQDSMEYTAHKNAQRTGSVLTVMSVLSLFCTIGCGAVADIAEIDERTNSAKSDGPVSIAETDIHADTNNASLASSHDSSYIIWKRCTKKSDGNIQCVHSYPQYTKVELTNNTKYTVSLQIDEYHSHCGFPGFLASRSWHDIDPFDVTEVDYSPFAGFGCREKWVVNCKLDGYIPVRCADILDAWMSTDFR